MSWFNRLAGYPDGDPTGRDRALFRKVGAKAANAFIADKDISEAGDIIQTWANEVARQCGDRHPDIGRATLLTAVFFTMMAQYEVALQLAAPSKEVLQPLGANDYDFRAADYLHGKLAEVVAGTWDRTEGPIIDKGTPAGDFLFDLKP